MPIIPAIPNQQTDILEFISINSTELTEGSRKSSINQAISVSDVETASGKIKRFFNKNKKTLTINYSYIGSTSGDTVDGRVGRDFIHNLALNSPSVQISYVDKPNGPIISFNAFISNYSESIVRRDLSRQCIYYELSFELEEA
jgi:hypothetical protein